MKKHVKLSFINKLESNMNSINQGQTPYLQVLIGPRQVGKTTSILHFFNEKYGGQFIYESADLVLNSSAAWLSEQWSKALTQQKILIIDEIQKVENWSEIIKSLWDKMIKNKTSKMICVLLGSSSLQIQKGLSESLTGRFQLLQAFHWNSYESQLGYELDFQNYLKFGGYPGAYDFLKIEPSKKIENQNLLEWKNFVSQSIISTVIEKDILQFHNVKSPSLFRQAFEIISAYPAQEISFTKLLGQIQDKGNVDLIKYYLSLFEGAFLLKVLYKFSENTIRLKVSSPKIMMMAPCMYFINILDEYSNEERGRVFEQVVGTQLVRTQMPLYYWREGQDEVDFVLKVGRKIFAIEVKSGRKKNAKGLLKFKEKYKQAYTCFVSYENYQQFESDPLQFLEDNSMR